MTIKTPVTLQLPKCPKYQRKAMVKPSRLNAMTVLKYPLATEAAMKRTEDDNTLVFITDLRATKTQIKNAMKELFSVEVQKINTLIRPDGKKKAYIKLAADHDAMDVASKIGYI